MMAEVQTFLLAMTPVGELRAAIPVALTIYHLNWIWAYLISVIGNLIPVVFLLLFLEQGSSFLARNFKIFQRFFYWLFERTKKRSSPGMEKYGSLALIGFVAIPLPITGGWTGSLIAFLLGIPFKKAFSLIASGIIIAGLVVLTVTLAGIAIGKYFGWQVLMGVTLASGIIWYLFYKRKK